MTGFRLKAKISLETGSVVNPTSETIISNATAGNYKKVIKCYYANGAFGTGQRTIVGLEMSGYRVKFDQIITIEDTEEFYFTLRTFLWKIYTIRINNGPRCCFRINMRIHC